MKTTRCGATLLGVLLLAGCGASAESDDGAASSPKAKESSNPTESSNTSNPPSGAESAPSCEGAFAKIPAPYMANTLFSEAGAFIADAEGLVFSVLADSTRAADVADYPMLLLKSDLSGNLETLYTCGDAEMIGTVVTAGGDAFVVLGLLNRVIARVQRAGGDPVAVTDTRLEAGPVSDGQRLYYSAKPKAGDGNASHVGIYAFDPTTSESTLLLDQGAIMMSQLAVDADHLYWVETDGLLETTDDRLFRAPIAGGAAEMLGSLSRDSGLGSFHVAGGAVFGATFTDDYSFVIERTVPGEAPRVVAEDAGAPLLFVDDLAYYGPVGVTTNSLEFDRPELIEGTSGVNVTAFAVGPHDVFYSDGPCIYRAPQ